jgi:YebC/PmpR family DNA-binding regulatory protein
MSGHSKWAQIKRSKGVLDAKRGAAFSKLGREIMVAARQGGGNLEGNFRLRLIVQKARDINMPLENIERAIKKGVGGGEGVIMTEFMLEGYGTGGVAVIMEAMSDNRNRTVQEVRSVFAHHGGSLVESGSVAWQFEPKGIITVETGSVSADDLALAAIDAGAEDVKTEKGYLEVYTEPQKLEDVRKALEGKARIVSSEMSQVPKTPVAVGEKEALQTLKLVDHLEELDDVQHVYSNMDVSDEILEKIGAQV